jgi:hypothetical protein
VTVARIVSGGQTGVDRAALDAAVAAGVRHGGWCPRGGVAEDLPDGGLGERYPALREAPSADPAERTRLNVRDSDATLVVRADVRSPGTDLTVATARELGRPCLVTDGSDAEPVRAWLDGLGDDVVLNVAGPRESEQPGAYDDARRLLDRLLAGR